MKKAFIICNGKSRNQFDLEKLRNCGKIFGCNAVYRDFWPDYLIAIDHKMIKEIYNSNFPSHKFIVPPEKEKYELTGTGKKSNAGMNAMYEAIKRGYNKLYILGFDSLIKDDKYSSSNIYEGTNSYGEETKTQISDNYYRILYLTWFANKFSDTKFIFVFERKPMQILDVNAKNVSGIFYDEFEKVIKDA